MATPFTFPVRIYYEDTDAGGVVYYANYLKFMERARTEWLRAHGFEQDQLIEEYGVIFAVRSANISYQAPARFNDLLEVSATLLKVGRASLSLTQEVRRAGEEQVLCEATVKAASLDAERFRPKAMPAPLYDAITQQL